jgi:hypothetical protein
MKIKEMLNKLEFWKKNGLYPINLVEGIGNIENYKKVRDIIILGESNAIKNTNQKSHENLGIFPKMKKFVAFFQANPGLGNLCGEFTCAQRVWLENFHKITENQYKIIKNSYKIEDLEI